MATFLTEHEKDALEARIRAAESGTRGEIVTVIARASDDYRYIPTLWAALAALSVPGLYYLYERARAGGWPDPAGAADALALVWPVQALVFLGLGALFQLPRARAALVPKSVRDRRAARHAREQFFLRGLHATELRCGALVFVSLAERYVEILVDSGLAERVDEGVWDEAVAEFVTLVRAGRVAEGFAVAVDRCAEVLGEHFPDETGGGRPNELPDRLIEL